MYLINLHAHTIFSDGYNSPLRMAMTSKELGFTALCITDHFRNEQPFSNYNFSLCQEACREAREVLPIILGMEILVEGAEMLLFGGEAIKQIRRVTTRSLSYKDIHKVRKRTYCATILCHPGQFTNEHAELVDGFERINSGRYWFNTNVEKLLSDKVAWCNSDAHTHENLKYCWNEVDTKIVDEADLIRYIKRGKQPILINNRKEED